MNLSDLRVGNIVFDTVRLNEIKLEIRHFKELAVSEKAFFQRYKPVLIDLDFENKLRNQTNLMALRRSGKFESLKSWGVWFFQKGFIANINYKHEFQNIYYSLTQTEFK